MSHRLLTTEISISALSAVILARGRRAIFIRQRHLFIDWHNYDGILHEAILTQYDTVSVLIGPRHGSKKVGEGSAIILAIIGGTNLGKVLCHRKP